MVILAVVLALFPNGSLVAASHDATEAPQQLPFCNDDVQQSNKNAGYYFCFKIGFVNFSAVHQEFQDN